MTAALEFVHAAAEVLASHANYTWNKSATRIRCNGADCGAILDAANGDDEAVVVFARHQAGQLPGPAEPEAPPQAEPDVPAIDPPTAQEPEITGPAADDHLDPETEPAGEPMSTDVTETTTAPKIRRDTKALAATIAELKKGDRVTAFFKHPRYGEFAVEGTVIKGGTGLDRNQLIVGGWFINLNARATKYLQELIVVALAGKHEFAIPKPSEQTDHVGIGS